MQVIDQIHRILRVLVTRDMASPYVLDEDGKVRVVHRPQHVTGLLELGVREIAHYGSDSVRILPRLAAMLIDLRSCTLASYRPTIERLLAEVQEAHAEHAAESAFVTEPSRVPDYEESGS